jgi:hypothetical protein
MKRLHFLFIIPVLLLGYANCGEFKSVGEIASNLSSSCVAKVRSATNLVSFSSDICNDMATFSCDRRVFRPSANAATSKKNECVHQANGEDACVEVTTFGFPTESARQDAAPGAYDEGGEYNHEEVQCMNSSVMLRNISVVVGEGPTLDEALSSAISRCQEKGTK